jgi:glycosyltransferase involved in cell wall biosynthesis
VPERELGELYRQASVFVLTPQEEGLNFEGFGLVYLEAGAYGLPVVATRSGGVPDAVKDGITGFLAEEGDIQGTAEGIIRLLSDPELNRRMGRANREWAETLSWERCAAEQFRMYQEVVSGL